MFILSTRNLRFFSLIFRLDVLLIGVTVPDPTVADAADNASPSSLPPSLSSFFLTLPILPRRNLPLPLSSALLGVHRWLTSSYPPFRPKVLLPCLGEVTSRASVGGVSPPSLSPSFLTLPILPLRNLRFLPPPTHPSHQSHLLPTSPPPDPKCSSPGNDELQLGNIITYPTHGVKLNT
jgi:hypothetical protein